MICAEWKPPACPGLASANLPTSYYTDHQVKTYTKNKGGHQKGEIITGKNGLPEKDYSKPYYYFTRPQALALIHAGVNPHLAAIDDGQRTIYRIIPNA